MYYNDSPAPKARRWSWPSFGAGIATGAVVGVAGVFALGAVLFEDDIRADLAAASDGQASVSQVQEYAARLTTCDAHDRACHRSNQEMTSSISEAIDNPPAKLQNALVSFSTEYNSFVSRDCGVNTSNVMCGLAGMNMNMAVATIKAEATNLGS